MTAAANHEASKKKKSYILGLDVGTTKIRAFVYDEDAEVIGQADDRVLLLYPKPGYVEIEPGQLWESVLKVLKGAVKGMCLRTF